MNRMSRFAVAFLLLTPVLTLASDTPRDCTIQGKYLEARSCDVYTGPCFANGEVGITGTEAILTWAVDRGAWDGVNLDGLSVIAVLRASHTLGDPYRSALPAKALVIVDAKATEQQRDALVAMARAMGGELLSDVVDVKCAPITASIGGCKASGCARVEAKGLVEVTTRCLGGEDHICGNESTFYPPLTRVNDALPAFTTEASYRGDSLGMTWTNLDRRSAFLGTFARS